MRNTRKLVKTTIVALLAALTLSAPKAAAVKIEDITRLKGQRENTLTGIGLLVGLNGTGDGGKYLPAMRPLAEFLGNFGNPISDIKELQNAKNVAIVTITSTVPEHGAQEGEALDVQVSNPGSAKSLEGGRLILSPLQGPPGDHQIYGLASGPVVIEDPKQPLVGLIKGGLVLEEDITQTYIVGDVFLLLLDSQSAGWAMASAIAKIINDAEAFDENLLASVQSPKCVMVKIPAAEAAEPAAFIARVLNLPVLLPDTEARVLINTRTGTIAVSGEVEISPVVISHKSLTITTAASEQAVPASAQAGEPSGPSFVRLDPAQQGGARLQELQQALNQLKVPVKDQIAIIQRLHEIGKLHAKLIVK